jgi:putative methyltransferase (TIGR04325 family)
MYIIKKTLKKLLPKFIIKYLNFFFGHKYVGFFNYNDWQKAMENCKGYDDQIIYDKITSAYENIIFGKSKFQRDGTNFDKIEISKNLLISLLISSSNNKINVLDYGGGLGNLYFESKYFLKNYCFDWCIIDQKKFVDYGRKKIQNDELFFYNNIDEYNKKNNSKILIFSNSFQYIQNSLEIFDKLKSKFDYIFFQSLSMSFKEHKHHIKIEKPDKNIYQSSYPIYIYNYKSILEKFKETHDVFFDCESKFNNFLSVEYRDILLIKKNG